jgi:hypothetical protein
MYETLDVNVVTLTDMSFSDCNIDCIVHFLVRFRKSVMRVKGSNRSVIRVANVNDI